MKRTLLLLLVLSLSVPLTAAPKGLTTKQFVYVTNQADGTISGFSINTSTGQLTEVPGSPFGTSQVGPAPIFADSNGTQVYVVDTQFIPGVMGSNCNMANGVIEVHDVNQTTGVLTLRQTLSLPGVCATDVVMDNAGKNLYVLLTTTDQSQTIIAEYDVNPASGELTEIGVANVGPFVNPGQLVVDPSGKFVYTSNENGVYLLRRKTATGVLGTASRQWTDPSGALAITNKALFVAPELGGSSLFIKELSINNATGSLSFLFGVTPTVLPFALDVTTNSNFLATANPDNDTVSNYKIASNGGFAPVANSPFSAGDRPSALSFDLLNRYLYAVNFSSNNITGYVFNSTTGHLTQITSSPFAVGNSPAGIVVLQ